MKYAVRYYTKTGNTKRLAEAIASELGVEALPISEPVTEPVDYLFLGNSYYAFSIDPEVRQFVASLDKDKVGKIVNFGSAAMLNSTWKKVKVEADKKGIPMDIAKKLVKIIKDSKMKVQTQIQGDSVRVTGKSRDDLQSAIQLVRNSDLGQPFQFNNFRD